MINKLINNNYELIIKNNIINIKYYLRIIEINSNRIEIELNDSKIIINGNSLLIKCMDEYEIVIKGTYTSIQFKDEQS